MNQDKINNLEQEQDQKYSGRARKAQIVHKMGDKFERSELPEELKKEMDKIKIQEEIQTQQDKYESQYYQPKTRESKEAYSKLLNRLKKLLTDLPSNYLQDTAQEVLSILKQADINNREKKEQLETIFKLKESEFTNLLKISKNIEGFVQRQNQEEPQNINLDLKDNEQRMTIEIEDLNFEETKSIQKEDQQDKTIYNKTYLLNLLQTVLQNEDKSHELEQSILHVLNIEDEIECQNKIIEICEDLDVDILKTIFDNRFKIYYGYYFDINIKDKEKLKQIFEEINQNQNLKEHLHQLIKQYRSKLQLENTLDNLDIDFIKQNIHQLKVWQNLNNQDITNLPKQIIPLKTKQQNLISLFQQKLQLPKGSKKTIEKGYDEISIPPPEIQSKQNLIQINQLEKWIQPIFKDIKSLNPIQSKIYETAFNSDQNMLISAPTGAGKTIVALLTILGLFNNYKQNNSLDLQKIKVVYIAPMKALVTEIVGTFQERLKDLNIKVSEFTGDVHLTKKEFEENTIIVSTPEKWDVVSRKSSESIYLDKLKLIIFDEIHLLNDTRGPVIEAIVTRLLRRIDYFSQDIRIIGLSATLPNFKDVARFLRVPESGIFYFDNSYRPVPLQQNYIGVKEKQGFKKMMLIKEIVYKKVIERIQNHQILIFVHSRKETLKTAQDLKEKAYIENKQHLLFDQNSNSSKIIHNLKSQFINQDLQDIVSSGIGIHHAGLPRKDRLLVEDLFSGKHIGVLVSTATLAWGVNLPAHTVIIKNTEVYSPQLGKWTELNMQDILQMLGRAGRPLYDDYGEGIIITSSEMMKKYLSLFNEQQPIESQLLNQFSEQLNAQIASNSVLNFKNALEWLEKTYLNIRLYKNSSFYNLTLQKDQHMYKELFQYKLNLIYTALKELQKYELIVYNEDKGIFDITPIGKLTSYFYLKPNSIKIYNSNINKCFNSIEIIRLFTQSDEFKYINIKDEEKLEIQKLVESVPVPIRGSLEDPSSKLSVLLQCYISNIRLEGYSLNSDMIYISQNGQRIFRALFNLAIKKKLANAIQFLEFGIMLERKTWSCLSPLRQFKNIPFDVMMKLEQQEFLTWEHFLFMTESQIYNIVKNESKAKIVFQNIKSFPRFEANVSIQPITHYLMAIELQLSRKFKWNYNIHKGFQLLQIFVIDLDQKNLIYYQPLIISKKEETKRIRFQFQLKDPVPPFYFLKIMNDQWLNSSIQIPLQFNNIIFPKKFPHPSELTENINNEEQNRFLTKYGQLFEFDKLNLIQQEVFNVIYESFESVYLGALEGNGKMEISLISLIRLYEEDINKESKSIILYTSELDQKIFRIIENISKYFQIKHCQLSGEFKKDLKFLNQNQIIISHVDHFDRIAKNYNKRKALKQIRIFVVNDLHTMGSIQSNYEVLLSKMHLFYKLIESQVRFIALSHPLANYDSICDWLNIKPDNAFNFSPSIRKNDIDIMYYTYDQLNPEELLTIYSKKIHQILKNHNFKIKRTMMIVDNVFYARIILSRILKTFLNGGEEIVEDKEIKDLLQDTSNTLSDIYQSNFVSLGAGYFYASMNSLEKKTIFELYKINALKILLVPRREIDQITFLESDILIYLDTNNFSKLEMCKALKVLNFEQEEGEHNKICAILTNEWKKEQMKKDMFEEWPLESLFNKNLIDILNSEIASGVISNKEECIDWITWTFFYRRIVQNPNYYFLESNESENISYYLSELINSVIDDLKQIEFIEEEDEQFEIQNQGIISAFYNVNVLTVYSFFQSLKQEINIIDLIQIISKQNEFSFSDSYLPNYSTIYDYYGKLPTKLMKTDFESNSLKIFTLLQSYMCRLYFSNDYRNIVKIILETYLKLIQVFIDSSAAVNSLKSSLIAMKLCQMIVQKVWFNESPLYQIPFFDQERLKIANSLNVNELDDFFDLEDNQREILLKGFSENQIQEIADYMNRYPSINMEIKFQIEDQNISVGDSISLTVKLERENLEKDEKLTNIKTNGDIDDKIDNWWLLIADRVQDKVFMIRKIQFEKQYQKQMSFIIPDKGNYNLTAMLVCDSYLGCDIESKGPQINVLELEDQVI